MPEEQTIAKARSTACREAFDLHLYPVGGPALDAPDAWRWVLPLACMTPRSRGTLTLRGADPTLAPRIDHRYLSDPDGADGAVLTDGLALGRELAGQPALAALLGKELLPGPNARTAAALAAFARQTVAHYYHPVGTCAMGPATDPAAVVDARGKVHGLANAYVADASIMPVVPRANTNVPALVVGLRIAGWLAEG
jgi:choline dehydrogenase